MLVELIEPLRAGYDDILVCAARPTDVGHKVPAFLSTGLVACSG